MHVIMFVQHVRLYYWNLTFSPYVKHTIMNGHQPLLQNHLLIGRCQKDMLTSHRALIALARQILVPRLSECVRGMYSCKFVLSLQPRDVPSNQALTKPRACVENRKSAGNEPPPQRQAKKMNKLLYFILRFSVVKARETKRERERERERRWMAKRKRRH